MVLATPALPPGAGSGLLGSGVAAAQAADPVISDAERLIDANEFQQAYDLLLPLEDVRAGEVDYDYFLALSALRIGEITRSIYALERVLIVDPSHGPARLLLGEAYFSAGETEASKETFDQVADRDRLPGPIRDRIERFLFALDQADDGLVVRGQVYAGVGFDSNINTATSRSTIIIPAFAALGPATLARNARSQEDAVFTFGAGVAAEQKMDDRMSMIGSISYDRHDAVGSGNFDIDEIDINLGLAYTDDSNRVTLTAQWQPTLLGYDFFRDSFGGLAVWRHAFTDSLFGALFGQYQAVMYPDQSVRNAHRFAAGANVIKRLDDIALRPELFGQVYAGAEIPWKDGNPHLGNNFVGGRVGVDVTLMDDTLEGFASTAFELRDYRGPDPLFLSNRDDTQFSFKAGLRYKLTNDITLVPEISYINNDSDISLYSYDRVQAIVTVRYEF